VDGGLSILQYADDIVLFLDHDLDKAKNLKLFLCMFEQLSRLKINFHKSEIFCFGDAEDARLDYVDLFFLLQIRRVPNQVFGHPNTL
jgi:hypothetical protein